MTRQSGDWPRVPSTLLTWPRARLALRMGLARLRTARLEPARAEATGKQGAQSSATRTMGQFPGCLRSLG
eukprot:10307172-Alexandrium_andersonii.AAC.1